MRAQPKRPVIPRRVAAFRAGAKVTIAPRVEFRWSAGLLAELPGSETGSPELERSVCADHFPDSPVDDHVVARMNAGLRLLEVLLEPGDRGQTPVLSILARIPDAAQGIDQSPESRPTIVRSAGIESPRSRPDRELQLIVEGAVAAIQ